MASAAAALTLAPHAGGAQAQETGAQGGRVGSFLVFPSLTVREKYDSNIFAEPDGEEGDFITGVAPQIAVESQWANHALNFNAGANWEIYADNSDENSTAYNVGVDGRLDIRRHSYLFGGLSWDREIEERGSPEDVNGEEPTEFDVANITAGGFHRFNRLSFRLTNTYDDFDFSDVDRPGGGDINNDDRDRAIFETTLRASYQVHPDFSAFVEGSYNIRDYESDTDDAGVNRDSDGYAVALGSEIDLTGITVGEASIGYRRQEFDDPDLDEASGLSFNAGLTSEVTRLTTLSLDVRTSIDETTVTQNGDSAAGGFARGINFGVEHELLRSVLLNADAGLVNEDFEGIDRTDNTITAGLGGRYLFNRYADVSVGYEYTRRDSDESEVEYDKHVVFVGLTVKY